MAFCHNVPYIVTEKLKNLPVYKLRPQTGTGRVRTLHRDHLLPIGDSVRISTPSGTVEDMRPPITRAQTAREKQLKERVSTTNEQIRGEPTSDSDDEICYYIPERCRMQNKPLCTLLPEPVAEEAEHRADGGRSQDSVTEGSQEEESPKETETPVCNIPAVDTASTDSRPKRTVKPVIKLSYDDLGQPSDKPLSTV